MEQTKYASGVGALLYLVKHSRPDIANSTRELSKAMQRSNYSHYKALIRCIKYVNTTENLGLILQPKNKQTSNTKTMGSHQNQEGNRNKTF